MALGDARIQDTHHCHGCMQERARGDGRHVRQAVAHHKAGRHHRRPQAADNLHIQGNRAVGKPPRSQARARLSREPHSAVAVRPPGDDTHFRIRRPTKRTRKTDETRRTRDKPLQRRDIRRLVLPRLGRR